MATQNIDRFKFRFFKTDNNHMYYNVEKNSDDVFEEDNTRFGYLIASKIGYLMQCTNLKDKNDKLIYEGDIVLSENDNNKYVISWDNGCFTFRKVNCKLHFVGAEFEFRTDTEGDDYTVIGNIYENHELI